MKKHEENKMKNKILRRFNAANPTNFDNSNPKSKHPYSKDYKSEEN